ncbi:tail fiber assembly protein [Enterobacter cloacae]|uniref:tail fiber assembly protein n=1 Tax=Enterobacter cloacae TaxID=550 RepID=UPI0018C257E2|nr:tail fiber assembly protein [Enterobacter cloacae]MBG0522596.1 tail fiber assembly protein [Enterobacter cloacae]MCK7318304.1 tail fiber assembly protein [Enterobacter cloacae]HDC4367622.1 tail fiber assembly protein [Enterobacter cloacae]
MDQFINPVVYKFEHVEINGFMRTGLYFHDEQGRDWYETLTEWKGAVSLDNSGIVIAYEKDVSYMGMEEGRNVYEVNPLNVPHDVLGNFKYENGVFYDIRPDAAALADQKRKQLIKDAGLAISILQDAVELGAATEGDIELLRLWKTYRLRLSRISVATAPEIEWPQPPSSV